MRRKLKASQLKGITRWHKLLTQTVDHQRWEAKGAFGRSTKTHMHTLPLQPGRHCSVAGIATAA